MKRLTELYGGVLVMLLLSAAIQPAQAQIGVALPGIIADPGEEIVFGVDVENLDGAGALAYSIDIIFDPAVLQIDGVVKAGTISANAFTSSNAVDGVLYIRAASGSALSGSGSLINIEATILAAGSSPLSFAVVTFEGNEGNIPSEAENGFVTTSNAAPTTTNVSAETDEEVPVEVIMVGADAEGVDLTFSILSQPDNGSLGPVTAIDGETASVTYTPDEDYSGEDSFTFSVSDGENSASGTATITVAPVQDVPEASDDSYDVDEDTELSVSEGEGVLQNDIDADGEVLSAILVTDVTNGELDLSADGSFTYTPDSGYSGTDFFTYVAFDGIEESEPATVTINVVAVAVITHGAELSGWNVITPNSSSAAGSLEASVEGTSLMLSGSFSGLSSAVAQIEVRVGEMDEDGVSVLPLNPMLTTGEIGGTLDAESNTFDLVDSLVTALEEGRLYVSITTMDFPDGEIRGQIRGAGNEAPSESDIISPEDMSHVMVGGSLEDPAAGGDALIDITWESASDPDGDPVAYVYEVAADADFESILSTTRFPTADGFVLTVADAAEIFDTVTGGTPGNIAVGSTLMLYHRIVTTDGSHTSVGTGLNVNLTRGQIVSTESSDLPGEFSLNGNYPNPFNPTTTIEFDLPSAALVSVQVIDALGREVLNVPARSVEAGKRRTVDLDGSAMTSGTYLYRLVARLGGEQIVRTGTMILLK